MNPLQFISLLDVKARMGLKSEASKLYLSYLWWVLEPILWALAFYFVFEVLLSFGRDLFFIMCGKVPFLWFSKSVTNVAHITDQQCPYQRHRYNHEILNDEQRYDP